MGSSDWRTSLVVPGLDPVAGVVVPVVVGVPGAGAVGPRVVLLGLRVAEDRLVLLGEDEAHRLAVNIHALLADRRWVLRGVA